MVFISHMAIPLWLVWFTMCASTFSANIWLANFEEFSVLKDFRSVSQQKLGKLTCGAASIKPEKVDLQCF